MCPRVIKLIYRQTDVQAARQTDRQAHIQLHRQTVRQAYAFHSTYLVICWSGGVVMDVNTNIMKQNVTITFKVSHQGHKAIGMKPINLANNCLGLICHKNKQLLGTKCDHDL